MLKALERDFTDKEGKRKKGKKKHLFGVQKKIYECS